MCTNPGHNRAEFTEKLAVQGGKGAAGESELGDTIMREERVSVLQEGDHNKPMVDPNLQLSSFRFKAEKWIQPEVRMKDGKVFRVRIILDKIRQC